MIRRFLARGHAHALVIAAAVVAIPSAGAQTLSRTADGKPDLSGVWQALNTAAWDIQDHSASKGIPAGQGVVDGNEIPYQAWARVKKDENFKNRVTADPDAKCFLPGIPRVTYMPFPFTIVQTPAQIVIQYEYVHALRNVFMNSPHLEGPIEWFMGDSRGHWEGDTLVVDVIHFTNQTWLDRAGNFHSEQLHVVERYTPITPDHLQLEITIEDPKVFTRPWKMRMPLYRRKEPDIRALEYECYVYDTEATARAAAARRP